MDNKEAQGSSSTLNVESIMSAMLVERQKLAQGVSSARTNLIAQARSLIAGLETPMEHILHVIWANVRLESLP